MVGIACIRNRACPPVWNQLASPSVSPVLHSLLIHLESGLTDIAHTRVELVLLDLLHDVLSTSPGVLPMPADDRCRRVVEGLLEDPASRWDIDDWAREMGTSGRTLQRQFRERTAMSFSQWRTHARIHSATADLSSGLSLAEVARRNGYSSASNFMRAFKRVTGRAPSSYLSQPELHCGSVPATNHESEAQWRKVTTEWRSLIDTADHAPWTAAEWAAFERGFDMLKNPRPLAKVALAAAGIALLAASCGSDGTSPSASESEGSTEVSETESTAAGDTSGGEPGSTEADDEKDDAASAATRTVMDFYGEVEVPANPERVVFMDTSSFGNAIALGFPADRIAGVGFGGDLGPHRWLESQLEIDLDGFAESTPIWEINLEQVAALDPDLIVMLSGWDDARDELLSIGVPVFTALNGYNSVTEYLTFLGDVGVALDRSDVAASLTTELEERVSVLKAKFAGAAPSATIVRLFGEDTYQSLVQPLFDELGLPRATPPEGETFEDLSLELVDKLDGDILWVSGEGLEPEQVQAIVESNAVFMGMDVVASGGVRFVYDSPWGSEYSFPAVEWIFDEIEAGIDDWLSRN